MWGCCPCLLRRGAGRGGNDISRSEGLVPALGRVAREGAFSLQPEPCRTWALWHFVNIFLLLAPRLWGLKAAKKANDDQKVISGSPFPGEGSVPGLRADGEAKTSGKGSGSTTGPARELGFLWWPRSALLPLSWPWLPLRQRWPRRSLGHPEVAQDDEWVVEEPCAGGGGRMAQGSPSDNGPAAAVQHGVWETPPRWLC